ncbi:hypothetical protein TNCV_3118021 [Trichonephila clavipes]|uniref:Uncharacterized protein n=1 Tax=Trichonephila clavipes TaxID=2585209 RepID=A0A8X6W9K7_TRICX|nr:hypothetical protein TNCV_3118021 [Trichonephila clavipes]
MATVNFPHHENPPTWAGVEPATLGAEGQRQTNHVTQPAILRSRIIPLRKWSKSHNYGRIRKKTRNKETAKTFFVREDNQNKREKRCDLSGIPEQLYISDQKPYGIPLLAVWLPY